MKILQKLRFTLFKKKPEGSLMHCYIIPLLLYFGHKTLKKDFVQPSILFYPFPTPLNDTW